MSGGDPRIGSVWTYIPVLTGSVLTGSVLTGSVLTDIMRTDMVEIAMLVRTDIPEPTYKTYAGLSSRFFVCAGEGKPSQVYLAWLCRIRGRHLISDGGQGVRPIPSITEQGMAAYRKWTMRYVSTIPLTGAVRGSRG